ncbi:Eukaryotic_translation initiation factor 2 gamma subunit [Hexamita inflata]|uniref:protein-synthesizing GTPase n=2 Tax=Hexamita inflata TaxID=28002 RepID=A0AA86PCY9_9EUKA|nr:Eukaryotic translation initiation factor 2 gamma subunit [Hexamita inflata]CAI9952614.1 Eukaryotic translation initiation factor 2 gamma subunit [Hexamita inflata]CAI9959858.1 Eukaryotic translation initiation factor 2 gamma subunit [Hexamita inflata]
MSQELQPAYLSQQSASIQELHESHPDIISRQATINIGTIGHVAHGKSSLTRALTSVDTVKFSDEKVNNITIKLGYANAKIFECRNSECTSEQRYFTSKSDTRDDVPCPKCEHPSTLIRHISIIDCPGHDDYMTTMLSGAALMDATMLLIAADQPCPQSQTVEHLQAITIGQNQNPIIVAQNKIDLVNETQARQNYSQIQSFLGAALQNKAAPSIIPISAARNLNIEHIINEIVKIPVPKRSLDKPPRFVSIRSFDTNRSGQSIDQMQGGIIGGTLIEGILKVGDIIEIRPGIIETTKEKTHKCYPLTTKIISLKAEGNDLKYALPGGLIAIGTMLDPALTKSDKMIGQVLGYPGTLPDIITKFKIKFYLLINKDQEVQTFLSEELGKLTKCGSEILITVSGCNVSAIITSEDAIVTGNGSEIEIQVSKPICIPDGVSIAISSKGLGHLSKNWRLIGYGIPVVQKREPKQQENIEE